MSLILFFGMVSIIILIGIGTIVSTLLQWKHQPKPNEAGSQSSDLQSAQYAVSELKPKS